MSEGQYCTYCGAKNKIDNAFCQNCGQSLDDKVQPSQRTTSHYAPSRQTQGHDSRTSISGSFDAVPGQQTPYLPQQRRSMPGFVKLLILIFFLTIPGLFFLFLYLFGRF